MSETLSIPEIPLRLAPSTPDAAEVIGFKWAPPEVGTRHKLGGSPDWLQQSEIPICSCGKSMSFYAQLDSIGDSVCIADCGMVYIFVCFGCFQTKSVLQSAQLMAANNSVKWTAAAGPR